MADHTRESPALPLTILATWFDEMGHGIAGALTGSSFERLLIFRNGSNVAQMLTPADGSRVKVALVTASGPLGPAIAGAMLIIASRSPRSAHGTDRSWSSADPVDADLGEVFGGLDRPPCVGNHYSRAGASRYAVSATAWHPDPGVQACISAWRQFGYLFSSGGRIGDELHRFDTSAIADAMLLPYWMWGMVISAAIVALLWWSLKIALRP